MSFNVEIKVHEIATDGLPDMDNEDLTGRVAFIWDGALISGWPIGHIHQGVEYDMQLWEGSEGRILGPFYGVTHWVELPSPIYAIPKLTDDGLEVVVELMYFCPNKTHHKGRVSEDGESFYCPDCDRTWDTSKAKEKT